MPISYYLLRKEAKSSSIIISVSNNGYKYKAATGLKCNPNYWIQKSYTVSKKEKKHAYINNILNKYNQQINDKLYKMELLGEKIDLISIKAICSEVKQKLNIGNKIVVTKSDPIQTMDDIHELFTDFQKFINIRSQDPNFSTGIVKNYKKVLNHLKRYVEFKKRLINYNDIDLRFYTEYVNYLSYELTLQRNSVGSSVKILKTFLNWSLNEEYHNNTKFQKVLKVWKEGNDAIALDDDDIRRIEEVDLSCENTLLKVRDIFLICLFTGLRYGDYNKLQPAHINMEKKDIRLITNKTRDVIGIPIDKRLESIFHKYHDLRLPKMSNQKLNEHIKQIAEKAGLTEEVIKVYYIGNKTIEQPMPKYELITMHTARRTWKTKAEKSNRNTFAIMKASGSKDFNVHAGYVKYNVDDAIDEMRGLWD